MYTLDHYANMLRDGTRVRAYKQAIDKAINSESVVLDLGAGTGAFALYAAAKGAKKVYAVETNPLIELGQRQAEELGFSNRIEFFRGQSELFEVSERANLLISDLRGVLPFNGAGFRTLQDARNRLLTSDATIIPVRDDLYAVPISAPVWYQRHVEEPWIDNELGIAMPLLRHYQASTPIKAPSMELGGQFSGQWIAGIDYSSPPSGHVRSQLNWEVKDRSSVHAILIWFDSKLADGIEISAAPGTVGPGVYGRLLLPLENPITLNVGDLLTIELGIWPVAGDFVITWRSAVKDERGIRRSYSRQNSAGVVFAFPGMLRGNSQ